MAFADLKNDFVFRRIFATHPDILRGLLYDLLEGIPADMPAGPFREALGLANQATFTQSEFDAYQRVIDEINQARELAEAKWEEGHKSGVAEGHKCGLAEGLAAGKRDSLLRILARRGIALTEEEQRKISHCDDPARLDQWLDSALTASTAVDVFA